ncbi:hypothetical protein [Polynucleobacter necessarius]|uniref:hypothetical protein n=1 Tax=Polynucleobacter necessarius TaxID=576610 RepID=UPI000E0906CE|nr:hypothetical protein [Polynucleobacter necessarius]
MTGFEAVAAPFHDVHPIIVVLDNRGYGIQRPMIDGPFHDLPALKAELLPQAFGVGKGYLCETEDQLQSALEAATAVNELCIIRACVPSGQYSPGLLRLTSALKTRV